MLNRNRGAIAVSVALVLAGLMLELQQAGLVHFTSVASLWPVILVGMGFEEIYTWTAGENN